MNTETTDAGYQEIIRRIQADGGTQANTYTYQDENGVRQLVVYKYLKDRGWVFMVRDSAAEVYAAVTTYAFWRVCCARSWPLWFRTIPWPLKRARQFPRNSRSGRGH